MIKRSTTIENNRIKPWVRNGPDGSDTAISAFLAIPNACMFDSGNSDYMSRTPSGAGNRKTWTFSTWVKRGKLGINQGLFSSVVDAGTLFFAHINASDILDVYGYVSGAHTFQLVTTQVFRDTGAWYHVLMNIDTTQATASNRVKLYVNGVQITAFSTETYSSQDYESYVNAANIHYIGTRIATGIYLDGYLAETIFVDGLALTPSSFGMFDRNGTWQPIAYQGAYGTNGFHLDYADSADLGDDESGNGNDWAETNIVAANQVQDNPGDNFCVLNGVHPDVSTLSEGNLAATSTCQGTMDANAFASYWEVTAGGTAPTCGVINAAGTTHTVSVTASKVFGFRMTAAGNVDYINITDAGSWTAITTSLTGEWFPYGVTEATTWNFGQRTFAGAAVGSALSTANLPTPVIADPKKHFDVDTYDGTGAELAITALDFSPDLVWIKNRDATDSHQLTDTERGATKNLSSDAATAEGTDTQGLKSFDINGFTLGTDVSYNTSAEKYAAWCWKEGALPGFDIVSYNGNGANRTIAHSLGVVPEFGIWKNRETTTSWIIWHKDLTDGTYFVLLDTTAAQAVEATYWNSTIPTSSVFSLGTASGTNQSSKNLIAYLFASVEGFSKFGSYEGNGNADGPFVHCGFRPAYVMCKSIDSTSDWHIYDNQREGYNVDNDRLIANDTTVEGTADGIDLVSNGFKFRIATDPNVAETYIYAAFAEAPFSSARGR